MGTISRYILLALGTVMTGLLVVFAGAMMLLLLVNIIGTIRGDAQATLGAMFTEALLLVGTSCFLNLVQTFRVLARIDPAAYQDATRGKGVVSYMWSTGVAPAFLHRFLLALDCSTLPPSFARRVRRTIVLDRLLLVSIFLLIAFGMYAAVRK